MRSLPLIRRLARFWEIASFAPFAFADLLIIQVDKNTSPRSRLASLGSGTYLHRTMSFTNPQNITIGRRVIFGPDNFLWASRNCKLIIEDGVLFGPGVKIFTANHQFSDLHSAIVSQPETERDVVVGYGAWLGANSTVLSGVRIGNGAIVAAGSIVNRDVDPYAIVAGVPARVVGSRLRQT